ncbi:MAG: hypothetical protein ACYTFW_00820 [Planctomycetota bacterium]|jgi:hypothetical protein
MGLEEKLEGDVCLFPGCGEPLIIRPDRLPLCSKHANKMTGFYSKVRPDEVTDKTYPRGRPIEKDDWD